MIPTIMEFGLCILDWKPQLKFEFEIANLKTRNMNEQKKTKRKKRFSAPGLISPPPSAHLGQSTHCSPSPRHVSDLWGLPLGSSPTSCSAQQNVVGAAGIRVMISS
jgi:hypothetical protein